MSASTTQPYTFRATINLDAGVTVEANALPLTVIAPSIAPVMVNVTVTSPASPNVTSLQIEFAVDMLFAQEYLEPKWLSEDGSGVYVPDDAGHGQLVGAYTIFSYVRPILVRLANEMRSPALLVAFDRADPRSLIRDASVEVVGRRISLVPRWFSGDGLMPRSRVLTATQLRETLARTTDDADGFAGYSDVLLAQNHLYGAVATLTTALETTAYKYLEKKISGQPRHFSPKVYLGTAYPNVHGNVPLLLSNPDAYVACEELWGARNEVVHNGRAMIRAWDPKESKTDPTLLRPLGPELRSLRDRVADAIDWIRRA